MRIWVFDDRPRLGIEAADRVLLMRGIPDHLVAIHADGVWAGGWPRQIEFLERFGFGIKTAELVSASLAEPHDVVFIHQQALRLALGRRVKLRKFSILGDSGDRTGEDKRREPLIPVVSDDVAIGVADVEMRELLGDWIKHGDGGTAPDPPMPLLIDSNGVRAGWLAFRQRTVLVVHDLLGSRIQVPELPQRCFGEPDGAVRSRDCGMNAGRFCKW